MNSRNQGHFDGNKWSRNGVIKAIVSFLLTEKTHNTA